MEEEILKENQDKSLAISEPNKDSLFSSDDEESQKSSEDLEEESNLKIEKEEKRSSKQKVEENEESNDDSSLISYQKQHHSHQSNREYGPPQIIRFLEIPELPKDSKLHYVRIPTIFGVEHRPFDPNTFEEMNPLEKDEETDQFSEDRQYRKTNTNPKTVIRWRCVKDEAGNIKKESNTRLVKWSDGSIQLMIGDIAYDVMQQDLSRENHYLFVRNTEFIEYQGHLESKLTFRPHQKTGFPIAQRQRKERRIKLVRVEKDPEKEKEQMEAYEEERIQAQFKLEQEKRKRQKSYEDLPTHRTELSTRLLESGYSDEEDSEDLEDFNNGQNPSDSDGKDEDREVVRKEANTSSRLDSSLPLRHKRKVEGEEAERRILKAKTSVETPVMESRSPLMEAKAPPPPPPSTNVVPSTTEITTSIESHSNSNVQGGTNGTTTMSSESVNRSLLSSSSSSFSSRSLSDIYAENDLPSESPVIRKKSKKVVVSDDDDDAT